MKESRVRFPTKALTRARAAADLGNKINDLVNSESVTTVVGVGYDQQSLITAAFGNGDSAMISTDPDGTPNSLLWDSYDPGLKSGIEGRYHYKLDRHDLFRLNAGRIPLTELVQIRRERSSGQWLRATDHENSFNLSRSGAEAVRRAADFLQLFASMAVDPESVPFPYQVIGGMNDRGRDSFGTFKLFYPKGLRVEVDLQYNGLGEGTQLPGIDLKQIRFRFGGLYSDLTLNEEWFNSRINESIRLQAEIGPIQVTAWELWDSLASGWARDPVVREEAYRLVKQGLGLS